MTQYIKLRKEHDKIEEKLKQTRLRKQTLRASLEKTDNHLKAI